MAPRTPATPAEPASAAVATPQLHLPEVTLCCVDTRQPQLGVMALQWCQAQVRFGDALLFTDPAAVPGLAAAGVPARVLPAAIGNIEQYSHFMQRGLAPHVATSHVLVVQWDGLVARPGCWDPAFLQWDYIGAPWPGAAPDRAVGNGGFSLRSRRLLQALQDPALTLTHPEDLSICVHNRQRLEQVHGLRFAPLAVAERFAYERTAPPGPTFGFHGLHNLQREWPARQLHGFIDAMPPALARHKEAVDLCRALIDAGQLDTARALIGKRQQAGLHGSRTWRLLARWAWARVRAGTRHTAAHTDSRRG